MTNEDLIATLEMLIERVNDLDARLKAFEKMECLSWM